ncbi:MAG TPA: nucleoside 2-deoxyribosyltransferase [Stellaceae bacterium]|nr:nucleoside 2-deoxyribosyltransferase [Stellaceae bacterium]
MNSRVVPVYLAGPDVFLPDAADVLEAKRRICALHGLGAVTPLEPPGEVPPRGLAEAQRIAWANEWHIRHCRAVLANLTPFRGPSADVGTVYEIGYARALGLPVFGYSMTGVPFAARTRAFLARAGEDGMAVEEFGLHDNLMIDAGIVASGGAVVVEDGAFEACVRLVARALCGGSASIEPRRGSIPTRT